MNVVPNTVAYRVHQAEKLLGHSLPRDPFELRVALEMYDVMKPRNFE